MVTQLHLALVMAIDARLLVLDEPTLGLDLLYRKQFYDSLLNDYFDRSRTIVVTTHQVEEIQHDPHRRDVHRPRPHRARLQHGRVRGALSRGDGASRPRSPRRARWGRLHERQVFGRSILLFDGVDREQLAALGEVRTPSIADLFVAVMGRRPRPMREEPFRDYTVEYRA